MSSNLLICHFQSEKPREFFIDEDDFGDENSNTLTDMGGGWGLRIVTNWALLNLAQLTDDQTKQFVAGFAGVGKEVGMTFNKNQADILMVMLRKHGGGGNHPLPGEQDQVQEVCGTFQRK